MSNKIYNVGAHGIPLGVSNEVSVARLSLRWSHHACEELVRDKYGAIGAAPFLKYFTGSDWTLVEAEPTLNPGFGNRAEVVTKMVVRREIDPVRSIVLVIIPDGPGRGFVKTAWINLTTDNHKSLDKNRFDRP